MFFPNADRKGSEWGEYTLVMPAVSVGNVGQLAADLLICTLQMEKVGSMLDGSFTPMVGSNPYVENTAGKSGSIVTACEVYESEDNKLLVIQQRSPFVKGLRSQFLEKFMEWLHKIKCKRIVLLGSLFAHERRDAQLIGTQLRYLATRQAVTEMMPLIKKEDFKSYDVEPDGSYYLSGGGITKLLFEKCTACDMNMVGLVKFCSEGDNQEDAITLANYAASWLQIPYLKSSPSTLLHWKLPISWRHQFGSRVEQSIY